MKNIIILLTIIIFINSISSFAQNEEKSNTIFKKYSFSGFGEVHLSVGKIKNTPLILNGGGGAFLINQTYYVGIYGLGIFSETIKEFMINGELVSHKLEFGHGGFYIGYIPNYKKRVHLNYSLKMGIGDIGYKKPNENFDGYDGSNLRFHENIFALLPQVKIEFTSSWFRMNLGLGYQIILGKDSGYGNDVFIIKDFNTPMLTVTFAFGKFKI